MSKPRSTYRTKISNVRIGVFPLFYLKRFHFLTRFFLRNVMKDKVLKWQLGGFFFIISAGALFHYVFEWTDFYVPTAWLFAVNESVWEHLKLVFWPLTIFMFPEYIALRKEARNFYYAKALA